MSYQSITIVGRLGKAPEMRYSPSGDPVTSFSVATDRTYTKDAQQVKETTWFRVSVWGKMAEACNKYLDKGKLVLVTGRLICGEGGGPRTYQTKDGKTAASFEINADTAKFLSPATETQDERAPVDDDLDVPF